MAEILTNSIQDYLKTIYTLTEEGRQATTTALADRLGVAPASVTGMLQKLASMQPPLVIYQKHQGAHLTPDGERVALKVLRHHRLLEAYLVENLGFSWDIVHDEACKLEHVISEEFEQRIAESLGHPERDPHGDPIPSAELVMPELDEVSLSKLSTDEKAIIRRVSGTDAGLLRHLESLGLVPGTRLEIIDHSPYDQNLTIIIEGRKTSVIGPAITENIFVEVCK